MVAYYLMSENILKNVKKNYCFKEIDFMDNITTSFTTHLRNSFAEIYMCELNILLMFHYLIFKSEHDFNIK